MTKTALITGVGRRRGTDTVRFQLSDQGRWINGQLLHCNGGFPRGSLPV